MVVTEEGASIGSIGGGTLEHKVILDALEVIKSREAQTFSHALRQDHGMCCGGSVEIYIEPVVKKEKSVHFWGRSYW